MIALILPKSQEKPVLQKDIHHEVGQFRLELRGVLPNFLALRPKGSKEDPNVGVQPKQPPPIPWGIRPDLRSLLRRTA